MLLGVFIRRDMYGSGREYVDFDTGVFYDYRAQRSGFPHREEYPDYAIGEGYYSGLGGEALQGVRRTVDSLPLGFPKIR